MCLTRHLSTFVLCFFLSVLCCQLVFVSVHPLTKTWHVRWRNPSSAYLTVFLLLLSPDTHAATHAHSPTAADIIVQLIVISAAQVEKCLFKVRTACVFEDNDTQGHLNTGFVRHWKRLYAPVELFVSRVYFSVCLWRLEQVFLIVCPHVRVRVCFVCVCVCPHTHRWESRGSGVCLVSRWSGNPRAQITAGVVFSAPKGPRG